MPSRRRANLDFVSAVFYVVGAFVFSKEAATTFKATFLLVIIQMTFASVVILLMEFHKMSCKQWKDLLKWSVVPIAFAGIYWPSAHPATVHGLWFRGLLDVRWDLVRSLSGAFPRQFGGLWGAVLGPLLGLSGASLGPLGAS